MKTMGHILPWASQGAQLTQKAMMLGKFPMET